MKRIGSIILAVFFMAACNNSASDTTTTDTTSVKDNTDVHDTGMGSSMSDTMNRRDTIKMKDTSTKKKY
jgi:PBP1b-binding outer membrane lipoprotein LpoB